MEGYLPDAVGWTLASAMFVTYGVYAVKKRIRENPEQRKLLGVAAAFALVLSTLKSPPVTGSCSHPTGTGLGALLFGPVTMAPIGMVVLLFQALLLAHGGVTTLGANIFSMAVAGPFAAALTAIADCRNPHSKSFHSIKRASKTASHRITKAHAALTTSSV